MDGWARGAFATVGALPGVHRVGLALAEGGGRQLAFTANDRTRDLAAVWCHVDAYEDLPLNMTIRTGGTVLGTLDDLSVAYAEFIGRQDRDLTQSIAAVPIVAAGQVLGGYVLFFESRQVFDHAQRQRLEHIGGDLGVALRQVQRHLPRSPHQSHMTGRAGMLVARYVVSEDPAEVAGARQFLRETFSAWHLDEDLIYTAALCLSELVTNAIIHARGGCCVQLQMEDSVVTTSVIDDGIRLSPRVAAGEDPLQAHGRGLHLVDALADRWGSVLDQSGSTVWFVLEGG
jgi:anti-sigma regulatory factor (Ser/Thr protein kinase)